VKNCEKNLGPAVEGPRGREIREIRKDAKLKVSK
jgi:hypothetical protein